MSTTPRAHLFFDLDGTLTDSAPGITRSLAHAVEVVAGTRCDPEGLAHWIGTPLAEVFVQLLGDASEPLVAQCVRAYQERFEAVGYKENRWYPGVEELLVKLRASGHALYVATLKGQGAADRVAGHFGFERIFDRVCGANPAGGVHSKVDVLRAAIAQAGCDTKRAVMVGDRAGDIVAATTCGLAAVGVHWGYAPLGELEAAGATRTVASVAELEGALIEAVAHS